MIFFIKIFLFVDILGFYIEKAQNQWDKSRRFCPVKNLDLKI